ncbi:hypothetical protein [Capnocytophaga cynodegmi]|uniref:Uncharacterized protein n=1 Tax=Capnocytophaga cynodegmi TaxID=28189 RepID=A0A0B7HD42_9FLAO|nr:hypothetical protein [Capnocytophaga cynodegmi]CEN35807.1 hypothetical protein CCYN2B_290020 [Capnocytophaga cynodegmi]
MKRCILFFTTFLLLNCKQNTKTDIIGKPKLTHNNIVEKKGITQKDTCICEMPRLEERYGIIVYEGSLTDNQEKLLIKLCENKDNTYAISVESDVNLGYNVIKRGKIYDYKNLGKIEGDRDLIFFELPCVLENSLEPLHIIVTSNGIHSIWRIKEGKLIEMDKNKEYPCIDFDADME